MNNLTQNFESGLEKTSTLLRDVNNQNPLNLCIICGTTLLIAIIICRSNKEISIDKGKIIVKPAQKNIQ